MCPKSDAFTRGAYTLRLLFDVTLAFAAAVGRVSRRTGGKAPATA